MTLKICAECKRTLELSAFHKSLHVKENIAVIQRTLNNFKRAKYDGDRTLFYSRKAK